MSEPYKRDLTKVNFIGNTPREPRINLTCLLETMHGQPIAVNGTTYLVSAAGALDNIPQTDANKLLVNRDCWRQCASHEDTMPLKANGEPADLTLPGEPTYRLEDLQMRVAGTAATPYVLTEEERAGKISIDDIQNDDDGERIVPTQKAPGRLGFAPHPDSQYDAEVPRKRGRPKKGTPL